MTLPRYRAPRLLMALWLPFVAISGAKAATDLPAELPRQPVEIRDAAMLQVIDAAATLEVLSVGHQWAEGPVAEPGSGAVLFSDVPKNQIWRWTGATGPVL